jgi:hypothetical protein
MTKAVTLEPLTIKDTKDIFHELVVFLSQYRDCTPGSKLFVVEGSLAEPQIAVRYPGRKVVKRTYKTKKKRKNFIEWANLCDFEVVAFRNGTEVPKSEFTYKKLFDDFSQHKMQSKEFCHLLDELYKTNTISGTAPKLPGIDSPQYLLMLKWMWIQEDMNYRLSSADVNSPIPYRLQTLRGSVTKDGAGRARFYASLYLLRSGEFNAKVIPKIITSR